MCSVRCSIGSVLNANCKIHCFGEPAIYFPKSFLRRNFHLNSTFSSPPRLFSHKYSFRNEVVFEYRNHRRPTFPLFSFVLFFILFKKKQYLNCFTFQSSHLSSHPRPLPSPNWRTLDSLPNLSDNQIVKKVSHYFSLVDCLLWRVVWRVWMRSIWCGCKVSQAFQSKPQSFDGEPNKKILFF